MGEERDKWTDMLIRSGDWLDLLEGDLECLNSGLRLVFLSTFR